MPTDVVLFIISIGSKSAPGTGVPLFLLSLHRNVIFLYTCVCVGVSVCMRACVACVCVCACVHVCIICVYIK